MQSDAPQSQPVGPAGLPPVPPSSSVPQPAAAPQGAVPIPAPTPAAGDPSSIQPQQVSMAEAAKQAKQLTAQYRQDPYRLNEALGQLKMRAQAAQYNIAPNSGGN